MIENRSNAPPLQLYVLGGLRIRLGDLALDDVLPQKARALLCFIALEPREHRRSILATLLWGESGGTDAATNLRQTLTHLRRVLDGYLVITRHTVAFNPNRMYWVDSAELEHVLTHREKQIDAGQLAVALDLYQGDFLHGFALADAPVFEEWVVLQRERLHRYASRAAQSLAEYYERLAEYDKSITATLRLLSLDRWREEAHRRLMWLYIRTDQRSAALAQYQSCRRILDHELGVEPMVETTALYERIRAAQADPRPPLVLPATAFVGRETEQAELARQLSVPGRRLLTIVGPGGIGKTRLALQVASEWSGRFLHGAYFVPLASITTPDAFVSTLASELGCAARGPHDVESQIRFFLADKDLLLVLDNFEHLAEGCATVLANLLGHATVKILVTSRERLQVQDEWLMDLSGLDVPLTSTPDPERYSAVELFVRSAHKSHPGFDLREADKPAVTHICRLVEGMPLGIELSAAWTRTLSCDEIAHEIETSLEFLTTSQRDLPARHRSLRAVFEHSWHRLAPEEQHVLRRLTVFRGDFSRDAAEQVAHASLSTLAALIDKSMLYLRPGSGRRARYDMHEMVRHYARVKLEEAGEREEVERRHLVFYLALVEAALPHLVGPEQKLWLDRLGREHDNIREALRLALEHGKEAEAVRMAAACWRFWWTRGHLDEGSYWLQQVLFMHTADEGGRCEQRLSAKSYGKQPRPDPAIRAIALHGLGVLRQEQGNYVEAQALHEQSLALRRAQGDRRGVSFSLNSLGVVAADQGDYARAQMLYEESLSLKREFGDQRAISGTLNNLGIVLSAQGHVAQAQALYEESLQLCRVLDDQDGIAVALGNLGLVAFDRRDTDTAERLLLEGLTLFQELGDRDGVIECLEGLASVATVRHQPERATHLFGATAHMREDMGTPWTRIEQSRYADLWASLQAELGEACWQTEYQNGHQMTPDEAADYARGSGSTGLP